MRAHYGVERVQAVEVAGFVVAFVDGHKFLFRLSHRSGGVGVVVHIKWRFVVFIRPFCVHLIRAQALRNLKLGFGQKICNQQYREYKQPDIYQQFSFIAFLIHTKTSLFHSPQSSLEREHYDCYLTRTADVTPFTFFRRLHSVVTMSVSSTNASSSAWNTPPSALMLRRRILSERLVEIR